MAREFQSSRDVIIRTRAWDEATKFYGSIPGLPVTQRSATPVGFETGGFCLYVEKGKEHRDPYGLVFNIGQAHRNDSAVVAGPDSPPQR